MQRAVGHVEQQNRLLVETNQRLKEDAAEGVVCRQWAAVSTIREKDGKKRGTRAQEEISEKETKEGDSRSCIGCSSTHRRKGRCCRVQRASRKGRFSGPEKAL